MSFGSRTRDLQFGLRLNGAIEGLKHMQWEGLGLHTYIYVSFNELFSNEKAKLIT